MTFMYVYVTMVMRIVQQLLNYITYYVGLSLLPNADPHS